MLLCIGGSATVWICSRKQPHPENAGKQGMLHSHPVNIHREIQQRNMHGRSLGRLRGLTPQLRVTMGKAALSLPRGWAAAPSGACLLGHGRCISFMACRTVGLAVTDEALASSDHSAHQQTSNSGLSNPSSSSVDASGLQPYPKQELPKTFEAATAEPRIYKW